MQGEKKRTTKKEENPVENPEMESSEVNEEVEKIDVEALQAELEKSKDQAQENLEGWQRERADFQNFRKRIERDQEISKQMITTNVIKRFLPIIDDMDRALKNCPTCEEAVAWTDGIELIHRKLQTILESESVVEIEAEGQFFDPQFHEAISHEDSNDLESGKIIEVIQKGYMIGDRVIRPALVRVAR
jgi:molecular chaperone GrpE